MPTRGIFDQFHGQTGEFAMGWCAAAFKDIDTWKQMTKKGGNITVIAWYKWTYLAWHGWRWGPEIRVVKSRLCHPGNINNITLVMFKSRVVLNELLYLCRIRMG